MRIIEKEIKVENRSDTIEIYPLGDVHIGARNCAEKQFKQAVKDIAENKNAYWIGGGDALDAVLPMDSKRFDFDTLPDWVLEGKAVTVRERLNNVLNQQLERYIGVVEPIAGKCIGGIEGNHEFSIRKYHNNDIQKAICNALSTEDLTDESFIKLIFKHKNISSTVKLYACHGHGGGRSIGSEPNHLFRMLSEWEDADIAIRGHSHTFHIIPPKPVLYVPDNGKLPKEMLLRYRHAANWGCWMYSHQAGKSTYASRACYPARPMATCKIMINPFQRVYLGGKDYINPHIEIRAITL